MFSKVQPHPYENADPELIFVNSTPILPLTPEDELFFNGEQWLVFDGETMTDIAFDSKEAALAFASRDIMADLVAVNLNYKPNGIKQRAALGLPTPEFLGV